MPFGNAIVCYVHSMIRKRSLKNYLTPRRRLWSITSAGAIILATVVILLQSKIWLLNQPIPPVADLPPPFPVGVDPETKTIEENPLVNDYVNNSFASNHTKRLEGGSWFARLNHMINDSRWYQQLASPSTRVLVIYSGERAEEVAHEFGNILNWSETETDHFRSLIEKHSPALSDGKMYPGKYIAASNATADTIATLVSDRFDQEITARYTPDIENAVPLTEALIIASLIEREAYDFNDMRYISGVIWNRLFIDMPLQMDSTLQYVRGSEPHEPWWPVPVPEDKYLDSPYNTYQNHGLPPGPISNPSIDAVIAALNPRQTDCLFYFHEDDGSFHCSATYREHISKLQGIYGQGR